jgi:hypothetical protein
MLVYPQLSIGVSAQYPITRQLSQRTIQSAMEDGTTITLSDSSAAYLRWRIAYQGLSDQEVNSLAAFFASTQGNLLPFVFLDPASNLLGWSEDFSRDVWASSGITFEPSVPDPFGTSRASRASNNSKADQTIAQDTAIPGSVQLCFSVYLRSSTPVTATLSRTTGASTHSIGALVTTNWQRYFLSSPSGTGTAPSRFTLIVPPEAALDIYGSQVDAQITPSTYVVSAGPRGGVYSTARFDMTKLDVIATGPNRNSTVVFIRCNVPAGDNS